MMCESESTQYNPTPSMDIEFRNLSYNVYSSRKTTKCILKGINGKFISGQFTAIIGPSGGGKTSLLNVLAGFSCLGITGDILINGDKISTRYMRKCSRYIMQEIFLRNFFTLDESMLMAANFKLSYQEKLENKRRKIDKLLNQLGLNECRDTMVLNLSGGQRRRLMIALELIDDPPILYLDEPTTGLDDIACLRCVDLLKLLAVEGRTVICALHTPSPKAFSLFDNVYVVHQGQCVYQGHGPSIVPYLKDLGLICPKSYNIPDFMLDVCVGDYGYYQNRMVRAIDNGKETKYCIQREKKIERVSAKYSHMKRLPFFYQLSFLTIEFWKEMFRHKKAFFIKLASYILLGIVAGLVFYKVGNDGSRSIMNYHFFLHVTTMCSYIAMSVMVIWIPEEYEKLKREHFNQWYGLEAYMVAVTISHLPILFCFNALYTIICYYLADQPMDVQPIAEFIIVNFFNAFVSESIGLLCGAIFGLTNGIFTSVLVYTYALLFCIYGMMETTYSESSTGLQLLFDTIYLRYSLEGILSSIFKNRPEVACPEEADWCFLTNGIKVMHFMSFHEDNLHLDLIVLAGMSIGLRLVSFYALHLRLNPHQTPKLLIPVIEAINGILKKINTFS